MATRESSANPRFPTLVDALRFWTAEDAAATVYRYTSDGETEEARLTRGELDRRARAIAAKLQELKAEGERAVLLYPADLDYIAGFYGCLYAGVIAVPAYPPDPSRLNRTLPRLQAMIADCRADIVLTTAAIVGMAEFLFHQAPELQSKRWIATDTIPVGAEAGYAPPRVTSETIAFLQYTSGSTGTPKGVILTHGNLVHNETLISAAMQIDAQSVVASWLPPYHDMGLIGGILAPMYNGAQAVLMSPIAFLQRPFRWLSAISKFEATISGGPNFAYDLCLRKVTPEQKKTLDLSRWRVAFSGAEPVRAETLDRFSEGFAEQGFTRRAFFPCYGLAEGTLIVSGGNVATDPVLRHVDAAGLERAKVIAAPPGDGARAIVGCGTNLGDQRVVIADPDLMRTAEPGALGEIWVKGGSIARGYWQRPEETGKTFGAHLVDTGEGPFLRTGDLGWLDGDELFVAGRAKDLIIIRGKNQYPQDLERTAEESHPSLRRGCAAAFAIEVSGEERLAIAIEIEKGFNPGTSDAPTPEGLAAYAALRNAVAETYDVRAHAVLLLKAGSIPKTSSGKIQRRETKAGFLAGSLDEIARSVLDEVAPAAKEFVAPRTRVEEVIAGIWTDVLGVPRVGVNDSFFDLGGHSLLASTAVSRARDALRADVTLRELFESPTLGGFAEHVEALLAEGGGVSTFAIEKVARDAPIATSFAQERLWFLDQLDPQNATYNIPAAIRLVGRLDVGALEKSLDAIVRRHEVLRTTFRADGGRPVQVVNAWGKLELRRFDHGDLPAAQRDEAFRKLATRKARQPFDLVHGPLVRAGLIETREDDHVLFLTMHHSVSDGWSMSVLVRELEALYTAFSQGKPSPLPALPVQYADYAAWQRRWLAGGVLERQLGYWRKQLEGAPDALDLPHDRPRPPMQTYVGARKAITLSPALTAQLRALSRGEDVTLYMTLFAAFATLLSRWSGQDDLAIGTPIAGRQRPETEAMIGFFVNTLVLRADLSGDPTFRELLARTKELTLGAYAHQDVPFEQLVQALAPTRDTSRSPLCQVMFTLQNVPMPTGKIGDLKVSGVQTDSGTSKLDLTLELREQDDGVEGWFEYNTDLFDAATIDRAAGQLVTLLEGAAKAPEAKLWALPMLHDDERRRLLVAWNDTAMEYPKAATLHQLFEAEVDVRPDAMAVAFEDETLSYGELERRANRLAHHLRARGVGPDVLVGLLVERSIDMVVALFAIMKAGGAYVPLDPAYPKDRLAFILQDARARVLVTHGDLAVGLDAQGADTVRLDGDAAAIGAESDARPAPSAGPTDLVYVIYTSGSTGKPKGVCIAHRALVNFVRTIRATPGVTRADRLLAVTSLSFDIAGLELYVPLTCGASVDVASRETCADGTLLKRRLDTCGTTIMQATPATWQMLLDAGWSGTRGLMMLCGGEALPRPLVDELLGKGASLWNMYGPTETTIWSSVHRFPEGDPTVFIGKPIGNTQLYVLDPHQQPVPIGVRGELYIGGDGLARGYFNRPELTAEKFVVDPFAPKQAMRAAGDGAPRLYRTGDLVRWLDDGQIDFLGRIDHQVKIRGFRIELGEIEAVLGRHPAVRETVAVASGDSPATRRLIAYYAMEEGAAEPRTSELRGHLKQALPDYMIPSTFVRVAALPRTPNGKIDRKRLPTPTASASIPPRGRIAPRGPVEEALAAIWSEVLGGAEVSMHADFFELGGHSLLATQVLARVRAALDVELPLRALFEAPTIAQMAERIEAALRGGARAAAAPIVPAPRDGHLVASFAQERMWVLDRIEQGNPFYNVSVALRLAGDLDVAALAQSLSDLVLRHKSLRTSFAVVDGRPTQVVHEATKVALPIEAMTIEGDVDAAVSARAAREAREPFDLERGPLLRQTLLRLGPADHVLLFTMHHIVSDEWSRGVLIREIGALYDAASRGVPHDLPPLPVQYVDYARWQRAFLAGDVQAEQLAYWKKQLDGAPRSLDLPSDRPRPATPSYRGSRLPVTIDADLTRALKDLARREGVTLYMTLLAAFDVLLARHAGVEDIVVGTPVANRTRAELEGLIGFFANTLVLRADLSGEPTFRALLGRVKEACLGAYANQDVPFERLVDALLPDRDPSRAPLFQVLFVLQNAPLPRLALPGLTLGFLPVASGTSKFDLGLELTETEGRLQGAIELSADLFDEATVARLLGRFEALLRDATMRPETAISRLTMVGDEEKSRILSASAAAPRKKKLPAHLKALLDKPGKDD